MLSIVDRHVIARESNVVRVDFRRDPDPPARDPDPPAPHFPGAIGLRLSPCEHDVGEMATAAIAGRGAGPRFRSTRSALRSLESSTCAVA